MKWMTIDPGISGTGFACFDRRRLLEWGNIYSTANTWERRSKAIITKISWKEYQGCERMYCEWPSNFQGTGKGQAAINSGSILKLAFLIGGICEKFDDVRLVPVQSWKGQLPKEIVQRRAEVFFQKKGFKSHAADAVGIGQWAIQSGLI